MIEQARPAFTPRQLVFLGLYLTFLISTPLLRRASLVTGPASAWLTVGWYLALAIVGAYAFRDTWARSVALAKQRPWRGALWLLVGYLGGEVAPLIASLALSALGWLPRTGLNDEAVGAFGDSVPPAVFLITVVILGPVTEELVFREALIQRAGAWLPRWVALIVSSLLFGLLHIRTVEELPLVLIYGSVGLVYGAVLMATRGNLLIPVAGHVLHNGFPVVSGLLAP